MQLRGRSRWGLLGGGGGFNCLFLSSFKVNLFLLWILLEVLEDNEASCVFVCSIFLVVKVKGGKTLVEAANKIVERLASPTLSIQSTTDFCTGAIRGTGDHVFLEQGTGFPDPTVLG